MRKNASSRSRTASSSRVLSEIRRSRVPYERARSSVIRLNAVLKAPISSDPCDLAADVQIAGRDGRRRPGQPADRSCEPPRDRIGRSQPQHQGRSTQPQQQPAQPVDRPIRLGGVDLGDQSPARETKADRSVSRHHVLAVIIDRLLAAKFSRDRIAHDRELARRHLRHGRQSPRRQDEPDSLALGDPHQDFAGFLQSVRVHQERRDWPEVREQENGAQGLAVGTTHHRREHKTEDRPDSPRWEDQAAIRSFLGPSQPGIPGNQVLRATRSKHLASLILDPECQKTGRAGPCIGKNRLGLHPKPIGADRSGRALGEEMVDAHPVRRAVSPALLAALAYTPASPADRRRLSRAARRSACGESRWWRCRRRRSARRS